MDPISTLVYKILALFGFGPYSNAGVQAPAPTVAQIAAGMGGGNTGNVVQVGTLQQQAQATTAASILGDVNTGFGIAKTAVGVATAASAAASALGITGSVAAPAVATATSAAGSAAAVTAAGGAVPALSATGPAAAVPAAGVGVAAAGVGVAVGVAAVATAMIVTSFTNPLSLQEWRAQQVATYGYNPNDIALVNPQGNVEHFGNYKGPTPMDSDKSDGATSSVPIHVATIKAGPGGRVNTKY